MVDNKKFEEQVAKALVDYERDGFALIENFLDEAGLARMHAEAEKLIIEGCTNVQHLETYDPDTVYKNKFYDKSQDNASYFYEPNALKDGKLVVPKEVALHKIGHGLHAVNDTFHDVTCNDEKVRIIFDKLGFEDAMILQGLLIFKNPKIGGLFIPHQDAQYLTSDPVRIAGLWYAMDDATIENGCLWFIPGSHKWPLARRLVRTYSKDPDGDIFQWTKPMPDYKDEQFIPVEVKKGSVVLLHGLVVHKSAPNTSLKSRRAYAFHVWDKSDSKWLNDSWLELAPTFLPLPKPVKT